MRQNFRSIRRCKSKGVVVETEPIADNSSNGETGNNQLTRERSIFRTEARLHYIENQEKVILPRLISKKLFTILWILALLLAAVGSAIAFWPLIEQLRWG
jgi:hypothetical protein